MGVREYIVPRVSISVDETGLIRTTVGQPNIVGIVGTADWGPLDTVTELGSLSEARNVFGTDATSCTLIRGLEGLFANGAVNVKAIRVDETGTPAAASTKDFADSSPTDIITFTAIYKGTYGDNITVQITNNTTTVDITITDGIITETYSNLASVDAIVTAVANSQLATAAAIGTPATLPATITATNLTGGANGTGTASSDYTDTLTTWETTEVDVLVMAGQTDAATHSALKTHCINMSEADTPKPRIGFVGNAVDTVATIQSAAETLDSNRIIYCSPGYKRTTSSGTEESLSGGYTACVFAGMVVSRNVNESTTNKPVLGINSFTTEYTNTNLRSLISSGVMAGRKFKTYEIAKDITTETTGAFINIPVRREVDFIIAAVRDIGREYIGRLNISSVRKALEGSIDAFLTQTARNNIINEFDENGNLAYSVNVYASRDDQIAGIANVSIRLQPVFSIYYIDVDIRLE